MNRMEECKKKKKVERNVKNKTYDNMFGKKNFKISPSMTVS